MRTLTHTSKDTLRSVTVRERTGRDAVNAVYIHRSLARPFVMMTGVDDIGNLPSEIWAQVIEGAEIIQQVIHLEGEWGDIVLPSDETDEARHTFLCLLLDSPERHILTLQEALKEVNTSPVNPPKDPLSGTGSTSD